MVHTTWYMVQYNGENIRVLREQIGFLLPVLHLLFLCVERRFVLMKDGHPLGNY